MSLFQTIAAGLFDGTPPSPSDPTTIGQTGFSAIVRSPFAAVGSYDLTFANPNPAPSGKAAVKINAQPLPAGGHNLVGGYLWIDPSTLRILLQQETTGALADGVFSVEISRVTAQN